MLIACPECTREVSDRARACPGCGFPVVEYLAEQRAAEEHAKRVASRVRIGEADCPHCEARGFRTFEIKGEDGDSRMAFSWCHCCEHSGRVHLCHDSAGYYAVDLARLAPFLAGDIDEDGEAVVSLGSEFTPGHRYPQAGRRRPDLASPAPDAPPDVTDPDPDSNDKPADAGVDAPSRAP